MSLGVGKNQVNENLVAEIIELLGFKKTLEEKGKLSSLLSRSLSATVTALNDYATGKDAASYRAACEAFTTQSSGIATSSVKVQLVK